MVPSFHKFAAHLLLLPRPGNLGDLELVDNSTTVPRFNGDENRRGEEADSTSGSPSDQSAHLHRSTISGIRHGPEGTVRARVRTKTLRKDWKGWTFRLEWMESGLRKCRWFLPLQLAPKIDPVNGVQEVAGSNPVAPTSQGSPQQEVAASHLFAVRDPFAAILAADRLLLGPFVTSRRQARLAARARAGPG